MSLGDVVSFRVFSKHFFNSRLQNVCNEDSAQGLIRVCRIQRSFQNLNYVKYGGLEQRNRLENGMEIHVAACSLLIGRNWCSRGFTIHAGLDQMAENNVPLRCDIYIFLDS
jgi:hypothetical protein